MNFGKSKILGESDINGKDMGFKQVDSYLQMINGLCLPQSLIYTHIYI